MGCSLSISPILRSQSCAGKCYQSKGCQAAYHPPNCESPLPIVRRSQVRKVEAATKATCHEPSLCRYTRYSKHFTPYSIHFQDTIRYYYTTHRHYTLYPPIANIYFIIMIKSYIIIPPVTPIKYSLPWPLYTLWNNPKLKEPFIADKQFSCASVGVLPKLTLCKAWDWHQVNYVLYSNLVKMKITFLCFFFSDFP